MKHMDTDVLLLFPPPFATEQPYLALPALSAYIRQKGLSVRQDDLAIKAFDYLTTPATLKRLSNLSIKKHEEEESIAELKLAIIENIDSSKAFLRGQQGNFHNFNEYRTAYTTVEAALELASQAYTPTRLSLTEYVTPFSSESSRQIFEGTLDENTNMFSEFLRDYVIREIVPNPAKLIGISIASLPQVIPAFTLLRYLRKFVPDTKLVIGGIVPSHLTKKLIKITEFSQYFDYMVTGEGESPLWQLTEAVIDCKSVAQIPNLIYWDGKRFQQSGKHMVENIDKLPTPIYDGLPLDKYLSPKPILSVEPARGCYYQKCSFCNGHALHDQTFRLKSPDRVIEDIRRLSETYHTKLFNFVNEGLSATHMLRIADSIMQSNLGVQWYAGARLEPQFDQATFKRLHVAGCTKLFFGLETASQRLSNSMQKGIYIKTVPDILRACSVAGIDIHLYLMVGYPSETEEDVELTKKFVVDQLGYIDKDFFTFSVSIFTPMVLSHIVEHEQCYVSKGQDYDIEYMFMVPGHERTHGIVKRRQKLIMEALYCALPEQKIPEEITHYLVYKSLIIKNRNKVVQGKLELMKKEMHNYEPILSEK